MWGVANDTETDGLGRPRNPEVQPSSGSETRLAGPELPRKTGPAPSPRALRAPEIGGTKEAMVARLEASPPRCEEAAPEHEERAPKPKDGPRGGRCREVFPDVLASAREVVEQLQAAATAERAELYGERYALAEERERLEEGCKLLEALVRVAKAVYDHDVEKV
ncbi:hypothetical protein E2562_025465 [Oryza meyeriana var. granulata]|uniref:Uncharacterized protein n=1 Tax=Oryza meyeriana var. granulata TaxID=110450 RepID=A0A6G1D9R6_9ORYZ|nr:hypothetical protein E2562_025465 [Oryza meyeriana var. granulata]